MPVETVMPTPSDNASAAAELAALVDAVEACRARLSALAERRNAALRGDGDDADSLLVSIFEAERGLSTAIRLLQRAVRSAR
ncbi:MAG: hypothetical protein ACO254_06680 [Ilumatobacteraceae bacterium]|nr:hypothetical protein [Acidimicrobiia bacterium]